MSADDEIRARLRALAAHLADLQAVPVSRAVTQGEALSSPMSALFRVLDFLDGMQPFRGDGPGKGLTKPLWDLLLAVQSAADGIPHPLLTPPKTGKRAKSYEQQALMAWAAITFDCLFQAGKSRTDAGKAVAAELGSVKLSHGTRVAAPTGRTVAGWKDKFSEGEGSVPLAALMSWRKYVNGRSANQSVHVDVWVDWSLDHLRSLVAGRLILQSPPKKVED